MSDVASWTRHGVEMRRPLFVKDSLSESKKVVIVGGGLSGMCNAFRIAQKSPDVEVILIEKSERLGGVISTWSENDWVCDLAVNATRAHPAFWRLIDDLNLSKQFKPSRKERNHVGFYSVTKGTACLLLLFLKSDQSALFEH